jgi:glycosyltransferase involved in cell wall biosynthesis
VPCVVSDTCGNPEAIEHGRHGLVVPMHAPDQAGEALVKLWQDRTLHQAMVRQAHEGLDAFDARHVTPMHAELYRQLLR